MVEFESFGFYTISADYLEFLNSKDSEVYYNTSYRNAVKPFVGIIIDMTEYKYFIPLTSAKEREDLGSLEKSLIKAHMGYFPMCVFCCN